MKMADALSRKTIRVVSGLLAHPTRFGDFLMGLRLSSMDRPGLWEFPGGKVEDVEDPREALAREWVEEIGLVVNVGEHVATGIVEADIRVMIHAYEVTTEADLVSFGGRDTNWRAHESLRWVGLNHAIRRMPCSPATYVHYPFIALWLDDQIRRGAVELGIHLPSKSRDLVPPGDAEHGK